MSRRSSSILILSLKLDYRWLVDRRMLPLLGLLYAASLIDRTNLGIARVAGMAVDLVRKLFSAPISGEILNYYYTEAGGRRSLQHCIMSILRPLHPFVSPPRSRGYFLFILLFSGNSRVT